MIRKEKIKLLKLLLIGIVITCLYKSNSIFASDKEVGILAFPNSYQIYLKQLKRLHPNWTYTALNTGLDWNEVIKNEGPQVKLDRSAIQISFAEVWKWKNSVGKYNVIETGWVTASEKSVAYTMDPRRYINEMQVFQFETLRYDSTVQNQDGVEKIFYGTLMYKNNISYTDTNGNRQNINKTYSRVVMEAASRYGISPYHLASRIKQETACDINNNTSIKGTVSGYVGLYNYYNIGATGGDNPALSGLAYARTQGWINPELAINGGAKYIAEKYINVGQYTTYLQKFNVNDESSYSLYTHQYMQNILAPSKEALSTYNAYLKMNLLEIPFNFVIPVYSNMPESPADIYTYKPNDFVLDSTKVYCTSNLNIRSGPGTDQSLILTATNGTIMTRIAKGVQAGERWDKVRLSSGLEGYVFQNYIKEYSYNKVNSVTTNVSEVEIGVDETYKLTEIIMPLDATYKNVIWESNNTDIVVVTDAGIITGKKEGTAIVTVTTEDQLKTANVIVTVRKKEPWISLDKDIYKILVGKTAPLEVKIMDSEVLEYDIEMQDENIARIENNIVIGISEGKTKIVIKIKGTDISKEAEIHVIDIKDGDIVIDESLRVEGDIISKIPVGTIAEKFRDKIQTNYNIVLKNINNEVLENEDVIGSGTKLQILDVDNKVIYEYNLVIFGDVTSDGKINSGDLLKIVKHLNDSSVIDNLYIFKAADVTGDTKINSGDLLKIVKYLNNLVTLGN